MSDVLIQTTADASWLKVQARLLNLGDIPLASGLNFCQTTLPARDAERLVKVITAAGFKVNLRGVPS